MIQRLTFELGLNDLSSNPAISSRFGKLLLEPEVAGSCLKNQKLVLISSARGANV